MAEKKKSEQKSASYKGFINVSLTKQRKEEITALLEHHSDVSENIEWFVDEGYKLSITFTNDGNFYTSTAMQTKLASPHAGYCTSARHGDLSKCLYTLRFQIENVLSVEGWNSDDGRHDW